MAEKVECPQCGGYYALKADGEIRQHNCSGAITINPDGEAPSAPAAKAKPSGPRIKPPKQAPKNVRTLGIAGVASGVEAVTGMVISNAIPIERKEIPDAVLELPDAEAMVGPFLDLMWPNLPKGVQKVASAIADRSDLIAAVLAWSQWAGTLKAYTTEARLNKASTVIEGTPSNVQPFRRATEEQQPGFTAGFEPFTPQPPSAETL